ncbi:MAG TPA: sugar ABC transporter permease [Lachnospiraceae bacterium]|jgi:oligogalacturonide transport system permease protein|nr:sugar ABC transporter permease [Lachnospiraceae bacterium]
MDSAASTHKSKFFKRNVGLFFILIWLIGFIIFKVYPFATSLYYSFTDMHLFNGIHKFGLFQYEKVFNTSKIMKSLKITFKYAFITVPLKLIAALFIAYILNFKIKGVNFFRTAYYVPSILGGSVAVAVLWKAVFKNDGIINTILGFFGVEGPNWLADPDKALWVICLLRIWQFGSSMVIFLAALKGVPADLYEAASLDGAGKWRQFFSVTIPLITPVIFYNLVTQLCQAFQEFNGPYIITNGGPLQSTSLVAYFVYKYAFEQYEMGLASAISWILFLILLVLTIIAFVSQRYWVYYSDDDN